MNTMSQEKLLRLNSYVYQDRESQELSLRRRFLTTRRNRRGQKKFLLFRILYDKNAWLNLRRFALALLLFSAALISTAMTSEYGNYSNSVAHLHRSRSVEAVSAEALWDTPAGCATLRLCCAGRNHSCRASLGAREHLRPRPKRLTKLFEFRAEERFPPVVTRRGRRRRIGELILPDTVALDSNGAHFARILGQEESLRIVTLDKYPRYHRRRRHTDEDEYFVFRSEMEDPPTPDVVIFEHSRPIIRYSVLNKFLPLRIGKSAKLDGYNISSDDMLGDRLRVMYVTEAYAECYCDAQCIVYADCCHDYVQFCHPILPQPCSYASWSRWSACRIILPQFGVCGSEGMQTRSRKILRGSQNPDCTRRESVTQTRGCFAPCQRMRVSARVEQTAASRPLAIAVTPRSMIDMTAVALLLDYRYKESRMYDMSRPQDYYRYQTLTSESAHKRMEHARLPPNSSTVSAFRPLPTDDKRYEASRHIFYCVHYELGWVNRNCVERRYKSLLRRHNRICVECQPHAQLHRNEPRCASDLEDGDKGLWKLIGPPSCNGIWLRLSRTDNCTCGGQFPRDNAFLMV